MASNHWAEPSYHEERRQLRDMARDRNDYAEAARFVQADDGLLWWSAVEVVRLRDHLAARGLGVVDDALTGWLVVAIEERLS